MGEWHTRFQGRDVVKQHHTLTQILMGLLNTGFKLLAAEEAQYFRHGGRTAPPDAAADKGGRLKMIDKTLSVVCRLKAFFLNSGVRF